MTAIQFRTIREALGLSQEELAHVLSLSSKQAVSNIETGFRKPGRLIMALMQVFADLPEKRSKELRDLLVAISIRHERSLSKAKR